MNYLRKSRIRGLDFSYQKALCFFHTCFPASAPLPVTTIWGEKGHVWCCPWPEGLSVIAGEPCTKLFLVPFLSFNWLFHLPDWFEGLEIRFWFFFSFNCQCVGLPEEEEEGSSFAHVGVSQCWVGLSAISQRPDWPSVAHNHYMLVKVIHRPMKHLCLAFEPHLSSLFHWKTEKKKKKGKERIKSDIFKSTSVI